MADLESTLSNLMGLMQDPKASAKLLDAKRQADAASAKAKLDMDAAVMAARAAKDAQDKANADAAVNVLQSASLQKKIADFEAMSAKRNADFSAAKSEFDHRFRDLVTREGALQERDRALQARELKVSEAEAVMAKKTALLKQAMG